MALLEMSYTRLRYGEALLSVVGAMANAIANWSSFASHAGSVILRRFSQLNMVFAILISCFGNVRSYYFREGLEFYLLQIAGMMVALCFQKGS